MSRRKAKADGSVGPGGNVESVTGQYVDNFDPANPVIETPRVNVSGVNPDNNNDEEEGYAEGSVWFNSSSKVLYVCVDASTGSAVWDTLAVGGSGTVTSVGLIVPTGLSVSGTPITSSGTFTVTYSTGYQGYTTNEANKLSGVEAGADVTDAVNVASAGAIMDTDFSANGLMVRVASGSYVSRSIIAGAGLAVSSGNGVSSNPTISIDFLGLEDLVDPNANRIMYWNNTTNNLEWLEAIGNLVINASNNTIRDTSLDVSTFTSTSSLTPNFNTARLWRCIALSETSFTLNLPTNMPDESTLVVRMTMTGDTTFTPNVGYVWGNVPPATLSNGIKYEIIISEHNDEFLATITSF